MLKAAPDLRRVVLADPPFGAFCTSSLLEKYSNISIRVIGYLSII